VLRRFGWFSLVALTVVWAGCSEPTSPPRPDGGPAHALELLEPPGAQIGIKYNEGVDLRVRYRTDDAERAPVGGEVVRFAIFDDPGGSTLASDRATTDGDGVATVRLTGGAQQTSFRVRATAADAPPVEFGVTVSLAFVDIDVVLAGDAPAGATRSTALLFTNASCSAIAVTAPPPQPLRQLTVASAPPTTIAFRFLLAKHYAILGRVEDANGRALASGCVDVGAQAIPAGVAVTLTLPIEKTVPSVLGRYGLETTLQLGASEQATRLLAWRGVGPCPLGISTAMLDGIAARVAPSVASAIAAQRAAPDMTGCRPATKAGGGASLDAQLGALVAGGPADLYDDLYADLLALIANTQLASTLELAANGPRPEDPPSARHTLDELRFGPLSGGGRQTLDLATTARTVLSADGIAVTLDDAAAPDSVGVQLASHGFTLDLGAAWLEAFRELALAPRLPLVMPQPPSVRALVEATFAVASRGGKMGCAAVEDLVCGVTGASGCATTVAPACSAVVDAEATALESAFADAPGLDFVVSGGATGVDSDGDLKVDALQSGMFMTSLGASAPFRGTRQP